MIGSNNGSKPDPDGREETPNPEVDREPDAQQRQSSESAYRYYRRRVAEKLRQITHEQHLATGLGVSR